jgi:hypothetical protein
VVERLTDNEAADLRDLYEERAAIRQYDGYYTKQEAERLAWGEVINEWRCRHWGRSSLSPTANSANSADRSSTVCVGCSELLAETEAFDVGDGNRVHDHPEFQCVIAYGKRWQGAAEKALAAAGLVPPGSGEVGGVPTAHLPQDSELTDVDEWLRPSPSDLPPGWEMEI